MVACLCDPSIGEEEAGVGGWEGGGVDDKFEASVVCIESSRCARDRKTLSQKPSQGGTGFVFLAH